ncbi:MAG TPA: hypothetical protein PKJ33_01345 [Alphaproteobacteria bacterium]|nr:hypothetical protein [Alphaproteobacteria bacterium]
MNIGIIGAGAWGTALAILSTKAGNRVTLWSYDGLVSRFSGLNLPKQIKITKDMKDLANTDAWLVVTPAAHFRETIDKCVKFHKNQPLIICTKGLDPHKSKFMSEVLRDEFPKFNKIGVLSGPQFAAEVAKGVPTGSTLAGKPEILELGHKIFGEMYLEESDDVIGTEFSGVGKNAVALIAGFASVKADGENEKALLFTRAWNEVVNIGIAHGAKVRTFLGLCGIGDLFLSATSVTSRNYSAGVSIAKKQKVSGTVEGLYALDGLIKHADEKHIPVPVLKNMKILLKI